MNNLSLLNDNQYVSISSHFTMFSSLKIKELAYFLYKITYELKC